MTQVLLPKEIETLIKSLYDNVTRVICGKRNTVDKVVMAFLAGGHVLLDDVPGVGKTLLAKTIARSINAEFKRIQCTPDLLPSDITGVSIFNPSDREFKFIKGPVFTNVLLVDEINRAAPRTQSCLLEAMEESQLTIEGKTYKLDKPFFIIATQNPVEYHGTFELPEAQLDRFLVVLRLGYPSETEEDNILCMYMNDETTSVDPVITIQDYLMLHDYIKGITVSQEVRKYIVNIANATREDSSIKLGVSPRGSLALIKMAQASALIDGRNYVIPDDVKKIAVDTLSHRIIPIQRKGLTANNQIIADIVSRIRVPG